MLVEVNLKTQRSVQVAVSIEILCTSIADIDKGRLFESTMLHKSLKPLLEIATETTFELFLRHHGVNSNTSVVVLALVELPRCAEEIVDGGLYSISPADGELAAFVLEP